jgi:transcriptional antiterminator NusG
LDESHSEFGASDAAVPNGSPAIPPTGIDPLVDSGFTPAAPPLAPPASTDYAGESAAGNVRESNVDESNADEGEPYIPPVEPEREGKPLELIEDVPDLSKDWYIIKVQSNREESIREGLLRRVKVAGLEEYFGEVIVPTETVTEFKGGKKRVVKRKLYPGYIVVNMALTDETWFLVRETPGIGDFTGAAGKPSPMRPQEVEKIVVKEKAVEAETPTLSIAFKPGARVKINEGTFENFEGEVHTIDAANGRVTVMINIFGRSTPVELEYWQVEAM